MIKEDKVTLARKRAELVERLMTPMSTEERIRLQGELSILNAKIKALNTTSAAQLKAAADRRKAAGFAEAQSNVARARVNADFQHHYHDDLACPACGTDSSVGCIVSEQFPSTAATAVIDGWIDAVFLRHDIDFSRDAKGRLMVTNDPRVRAPMEKPLAAAIELLVAGIYAAARGQELPELPSNPSVEGRYVPKQKPKTKKR
jgi:hypothetical protein